MFLGTFGSVWLCLFGFSMETSLFKITCTTTSRSLKRAIKFAEFFQAAIQFNYLPTVLAASFIHIQVYKYTLEKENKHPFGQSFQDVFYQVFTCRFSGLQICCVYKFAVLLMSWSRDEKQHPLWLLRVFFISIECFFLFINTLTFSKNEYKPGKWQERSCSCFSRQNWNVGSYVIFPDLNKDLSWCSNLEIIVVVFSCQI